MFNVEFHRGGYFPGHAPILEETVQDASLDDALVSAKRHASAVGAENIIVKNAEGQTIGVFSTFDYDID